MSQPNNIRHVFWVVIWVLDGVMGGCSSISGGPPTEKTWDFSRPYPNLPPARSPHPREESKNPLDGLFALFSPLWRENSRPASSFSAVPNDKTKEVSYPPLKIDSNQGSSPSGNKTEGDYSSLNGSNSSAHLLFSEAEQALSNGRNPLAQKYLEQAILCHPNDAGLWQEAAMIALRANQPELAFHFTSRAVERFPTSASLWQMDALARYRMGDFRGAEESARRAISLDNRPALSYFLIGAALKQQGQTPQAEVYFHQAARLDPKYSPETWGQ